MVCVSDEDWPDAGIVLDSDCETVDDCPDGSVDCVESSIHINNLFDFPVYHKPSEITGNTRPMVTIKAFDPISNSFYYLHSGQLGNSET